jgi:hypothetical protein
VLIAAFLPCFWHWEKALFSQPWSVMLAVSFLWVCKCPVSLVCWVFNQELMLDFIKKKKIVYIPWDNHVDSLIFVSSLVWWITLFEFWMLKPTLNSWGKLYFIMWSSLYFVISCLYDHIYMNGLNLLTFPQEFLCVCSQVILDSSLFFLLYRICFWHAGFI